MRCTARVRAAELRQAKAQTTKKKEMEMIWQNVSNVLKISHRAIATKTKKGIRLHITCTGLGGMYDDLGCVQFNVELLRKFAVPSVRCCSHYLLHPCVDEGGYVRGLFVSGCTEEVLGKICCYVLDIFSASPSSWSVQSCLSHTAMRIITQRDSSIPQSVAAYACLLPYSTSLHRELPFIVRRSVCTILAGFVKRHGEFLYFDLVIELLSFIPWNEAIKR